MNPQRLAPALILLASLIFSPDIAPAQVFDSGPSDSSLFVTVINLPADPALLRFGGIGDTSGDVNITAQLNVQAGGTIPSPFRFHPGSEVNISGGSGGNMLQAFTRTEVNLSDGSIGDDFLVGQCEVNISGGSVGNSFRAFIPAEINISGGSVGNSFDVTGSVVNISGGDVGSEFQADSNSEVNISGGTIGDFFSASDGSIVNISGGSVGDFSSASSGSVVNISNGSVGNNFIVNHDFNPGSEVNISGGSVGNGFVLNNNIANISGGSVGDSFSASSFSEVNISGGVFGDSFEAFRASRVNLYGSVFFIDGVELVDLTLDESTVILNRNVTLSGLLANGEPFSFDLNSTALPNSDFFDSYAQLRVTLTPPIGDVNRDGVVDFLDISPFIALLSSGTFQNEADINQNDAVDFLDIGPFIAILSGQ